MDYTFTCPLEGCNRTVMHSSAQTDDAAAMELTALAEKHLQDMHQDIHKIHEEVAADITAHMTKQA